MLLQCFAHGCVGICRMSYFDSVCQNYSRDVVILTVCVVICYRVYKVFFADSRSLDGISLNFKLY